MHLNPLTVLWIYIFLLLIGGMIGFFKAGSKVSLVTSSVFAAALILCAVDVFRPSVSRAAVDILMAVLIVVFAVRLSKTKKFMPSGLMLLLTVLALALRHLL